MVLSETQKVKNHRVVYYRIIADTDVCLGFDGRQPARGLSLIGLLIFSVNFSILSAYQAQIFRVFSMRQVFEKCHPAVFLKGENENSLKFCGLRYVFAFWVPIDKPSDCF